MKLRTRRLILQCVLFILLAIYAMELNHSLLGYLSSEIRELVSYIPKPIFKGIATGVYKDLLCGIFALEIFLKIEIFIGLFICLALALSLFIAKRNKGT